MISKYIIVMLLVLCSLGGWYLWHMKDADFMNMWVGSMTFFGCLFCALGVLTFAPNFLPFG